MEVPVRPIKFGRSTLLEMINLCKNHKNLQSLLRGFLESCSSMELKLIASAGLLDKQLAEALKDYVYENTHQSNEVLKNAVAACLQKFEQCQALLELMEKLVRAIEAAKVEVVQEVMKVSPPPDAKAEEAQELSDAQAKRRAERRNVTFSKRQRCEQGAKMVAGQIKYKPLKEMVDNHNSALHKMDAQFEKTYDKLKSKFEAVPLELKVPTVPVEAKWFWLTYFSPHKEVSSFSFFEQYKLMYLNRKFRELPAKVELALEKKLVRDENVKIANFAKTSKALGFPFSDTNCQEVSRAALISLVGIDPIEEFLRLAKRYHPNTRLWLYKQMKQWYDERGTGPASTVFALLGKAGVGKTIALAELVRASRDDCKSLGEEDGGGDSLRVFVAAVHLFKHDSDKTQDFAQMIRSISLQLEHSIDDFIVQYRPSPEDTDLVSLFDLLIKSPANSIDKHPKENTAVIVIDALDECRDPCARQEFLDLVRNRWGRDELPDWLKLVVSAREHAEIPFKFKVFEPICLRTTDADNKRDLIEYFRAKFEQTDIPKHEVPAAAKLLCKRSQGLFLYVRFLPSLLKKIRESNGSAQLRLHMLQTEIPANLDEFYMDYFGRIAEGLPDKALYRRVFGPLVYARRPVPFDAWVEICGYNPADEASVSSFKETVFARVQEVVGIREDTARFIHKSMVDFLSDENRASHQLVVWPRESHNLLAEWCFKPENRSKPFSLDNVLYHLALAKRKADLDKLLCVDYLWLEAAVKHALESIELNKLWMDVQGYKDLSPEARLVTQALALSSHALTVDWRQLPAQLYQRLAQNHPLGRTCFQQRENYHGLWPAAAPEQYLTPASSNATILHLGYRSSAKSVNCSREGTRVASVSYGYTLRLWDVEKRQLMHTCKEHTADITTVSFSPDGTEIASGSDDRTVRVWDVETGQLIHSYGGHTSYVNSVSFSPDGKKVASASNDHTVRLLDLEKQLIHTYEEHTDDVKLAIFSPDGTKIASGSRDHTVRLWDVENGQLIHTYERHTRCVNAVCFSPDGTMFASGSYDSTVRLWDVESGQLIHTYEGHEDCVNTLSFSPDGAKIASGSGDKTVHLCNVENLQLIQTYEGHSGHVNTLSFSPDGTKIASGSRDHAVRLWDVEKGQLIRTYEGHTGYVNNVSFFPDGTKIASGSGDNTLRLWDVENVQLIQTYEGHTDHINTLSFSPDGTKIASGSDDSTVRLWDVENGRLIHTYEAHTRWVNAVCFSPDGTKIAITSNRRTVRLWHAENGHLILTYEVHTCWVNAVYFSPDGTKIASGSNRRTVRLWDAENGRLIHTYEGHTDDVNAISFSADSAKIASGCRDNTVRLWDVENGQLIHTYEGHTDDVNTVSFSPDCAKIASGSRDKTVRLWAVENGHLVHIFEGQTRRSTPDVKTVSFSSDGTKVTSESDDNTVRLWDVENGNLIHTCRAGNISSTAEFYRDSNDNASRYAAKYSRDELSVLNGDARSIPFTFDAPVKQNLTKVSLQPNRRSLGCVLADKRVVVLHVCNG